MSKSRRDSQGTAAPARGSIKRLWLSEAGEVRTGWLLIASLLGYALTSAALRRGLGAGFAALFDAWNIDAANAGRAPAWAALLFRWQGSLTTLAVSAATLCLCRGLSRLWRLRPGRPRFSAGILFGRALAGSCSALAVAALCLIPDSLRLEWPIAVPRLSPGLPALCLVGLFGVLAEETFTKRVLFGGLCGRRGRVPATVAACAVFFFSNGGLAGNAISAVNVLLLGWVCCRLNERAGLWAAVGFRWGWSFANTFLLGFGGGPSSVYRLYGVSERLLTGGDSGIMFGLWATLLLAGAIALDSRGQLRSMALRIRETPPLRRRANQ